MPISHASYIHKPNDYTAPVDLNLLGKVLQYKENEYDRGVSQVQGTIDSLASMDVVKDVDRQYLNSKINNLVNTVNNIGGADYSDPNVSNQIAGLSSQIYGDDNVINAIANTKKFRYTQSYYKDLKEKKPKDWNPANEWYDMDKFSGWLTDGKVGSQPTAGAGSVTPYTKYEEDWQKMFDKIANSANVGTEITDKGLMYRIDTHTLVSPDRIWETASKMLTPEQRMQLGIEGRYTYNNLPIDQLTKAYDSNIYNKVGVASGQLEDYRNKYKGATALADQEKYQSLIAQKEAEIGSLLAPIRKNADQIKENLYLNDKLKGLQARYAFEKSTTKLQPATDKMFSLNYQLQSKKFQYQQQKDRMDQMISIADKGLMWITDPLTQQPMLIADPNSPKNKPKSASNPNGTSPDYSGLPGVDNSSAEQKVDISKDNLDTRKTAVIDANKQLFKDFVVELGRKKGLSDVIINDLADNGHLEGKVDPTMQKSAQAMMDSWNAMTRGEKINYETLDPLFKQFAGKYQENLKEIEAIDNFRYTAEKQVMDEFHITPEQLNSYKNNQTAMASIRTDSSPEARRAVMDRLLHDAMTGKTTPYNEKQIREYYNGKSDRVEQLLNSASVRMNLPTQTIEDDKQKSLAKLASGNSGTTQWFDANGKVKGKEFLNPDNIEPINKGYSYVETSGGRQKMPVLTFKYKTGSDPEDYEIRKVILNPAQSQALGFGTDVKELSGYNLGLHLNGEVKDINTSSGDKYNLKYDLVKYNVSNPNDPTVFIRVRKGDNVISLYSKPFPSFEHAVQFMESATKQKTSDDAFKFLEDMSK